MLDRHSERLAHRLAFTMSPGKAAEILCVAERPRLIPRSSERRPYIDPVLRRAAEIVSGRSVGGAQSFTIH